MRKFAFIVLLLAVFSIRASAQLSDFPIGSEGVPQARHKGPVRTVLTIQQRGEYVFSTLVESYDLHGRLTERLGSNANIEIHSGTLVRLGGKTIYTYDPQGRLKKTRDFTPEGQYTGYETYIYDLKNRLIETRLYDAGNKETGKRTYTYFSEKREVVATWNFYYEGRIPPPNKNILSYDEKQRWTKRTEFDGDGTVGDVVSFEYDANGNFIKETTCCKYNFSHRYSYEFDNHGNWIERRNSYSQPEGKGEQDNPDWMRTYRVITYYSEDQTKPLK